MTTASTGPGNPGPGPLITLLTDFGNRDGFVGIMKGVIATRLPAARVVDLAHDITPQAVDEAAFVLAAACRYFPAETVHIVVVDPGVGTDRRILAVRAAAQVFVVPDNGVLDAVLARESVEAAAAVTNAQYFLTPVSATFHGRDIFAPVAAALAGGVPITEMGEPVDGLCPLSDWATRTDDRGVRGSVRYCDRFGNLITNIDAAELDRLTKARGGSDAPASAVDIRVGGRTVRGLAGSYGSREPGVLLAVVGSSGYLEIAVNRGNAAGELNLAVGAPVEVVLR